jgi:hypothetical protein
LISNPFEENVDWHDILTANGLDYSQLLWDWNGFWIPSWVLETGKGYYYLAPNWLASLHIPYPGKKKVGQNLHELVSYPGLTLTTQDGNKNTGSIQVEFNPGASQGFDSTDLLKPGTGFESIDLYIQCASPVKRTTRIFCDSRKEVGEGQEYQISLKNQSGKPLTLQCEGQTFFPDQEIRLVSNKVNHWTNLKQTPIINVAEGNEILTLLVGTSEFVENQTSRIFTRNETLFNCFPNPVRETTTIGYSTKQNGNVTITLHDMTGRQVRQLADQYHEAGYHEFTFRKGTLPPGIYFCRMITHADQKSDTAVKVIRIQIF